jgi:hypothetical protein
MGGRNRLCHAIAAMMLLAFAGRLASAGNSNRLPPRTGMQARIMYAVTVGSGWQYFDWDGAAPVDSLDNPFTFTLTEPGYLSVTDALVDGDRFEVWDGATLVGTTSVPLDDGQYQPDPDLTFRTAAWSWGQFPLAAGAHSINIRVITEATGSTSGTGYLRIDLAPYGSAIPTLDLAGLALLAALLAGAGLALLRRG